MTGIGWPDPATPGLSDAGDTPADAAEKDLIEEAAGKHIVLGVRNFDAAQRLSSYLRLGSAPAPASTPAVETAARKLRGDDLARLVHGFVDDTRDRSGNPPPDDGSQYPNPPGDPAPHPFAPPQLLDPSSPAISRNLRLDQRRRESAELHTKGGWRDHTDGNRITTTRGDKVEVIRGNYKLVVLGRRSVDQVLDDVIARAGATAGGMDISGGINDYGDLQGDVGIPSDPDSAVPNDDPGDDVFQLAGLTVAHQWTKDSHGGHVWTQTTTRGHLRPRIVHGEPLSGDEPSPPRGFYQIINNNFVDYEEDNLGSQSSRVDKVEWGVFAHNTETNVDVSDTNSTKTTSGIIRSGTDLHTLSTTNAASTYIAEHDIALSIGHAQFAIANMTMQRPIVANVSAFTTADAHVGMHYDAHAKNHVDIRLGLHADLHMAPHVETHTGLHQDDHLGPHVSFETSRVVIASVISFRVDMSSGTVTVDSVDGIKRMSPMAETVVNPTMIHNIALQHHIL